MEISFEDLLLDVIHNAGDLTTAYEWGTGVASAQKELKESIAAIRSEYERKGAWARTWKRMAKKWRRKYQFWSARDAGVE